MVNSDISDGDADKFKLLCVLEEEAVSWYDRGEHINTLRRL